jgi:hypothetical protein
MANRARPRRQCAPQPFALLIQNTALLRKVLSHMQAAERGLIRLEAAVGRTGPEALAGILKSLKLNSMERIDNLETLKQVLKVEEVAAEPNR